MTCTSSNAPDLHPLVDEIYLENEEIMNTFLQRLMDLQEKQTKLETTMVENLGIFDNIIKDLKEVDASFDELSALIASVYTEE